MNLSETAQKIFDMKYASKLVNGGKESWEQACGRVASHVAKGEETENNQLQYTAEFTRILLERSFLPGGRILANAGTNIKNLFNCFVLPVEDSREGIYQALAKSAEVFAWGGGIGYNFSKLRGRGELVGGTGGVASGPVSFMELFDLTGEVISQASRRGAQMGILNVDHPDIMEFIQSKQYMNDRSLRLLLEWLNSLNEDAVTPAVVSALGRVLANNQLTHFNISVGMTDEFMNNPNEGILQQIASSAWESGDPGLFFIDRVNRDNMVPYLGDLDATNPCGEVPLLPYEPCCLGSINLSQFVDGDFIDFHYLEEVVTIAVRFLDNVHSINQIPVQEINETARMTRRLGLGVMGWADMLNEMNIPYNSEDAFLLAAIMAKTIQRTAWKASQALAEERGPFPAFSADEINWTLIDNVGLERKPVRNVAVTSIAPTGSISLIADCNSGIEPYFAHEYNRNITHGIGNIAKDAVTQKANKEAITAHEIHWLDHIRMQSAWQQHVDNAVSKTINMPNDATEEDIMLAYRRAWIEGCKGITVYRDGSKQFQILNAED